MLVTKCGFCAVVVVIGVVVVLVVVVLLLVVVVLVAVAVVVVVAVSCYCLGVNGSFDIPDNACYPWFLVVILEVALCMYKMRIRIREDLLS